MSNVPVIMMQIDVYLPQSGKSESLKHDLCLYGPPSHLFQTFFVYCFSDLFLTTVFTRRKWQQGVNASVSSPSRLTSELSVSCLWETPTATYNLAKAELQKEVCVRDQRILTNLCMSLIKHRGKHSKTGILSIVYVLYYYNIFTVIKIFGKITY